MISSNKEKENRLVTPSHPRRILASRTQNVAGRNANGDKPAMTKEEKMKSVSQAIGNDKLFEQGEEQTELMQDLKLLQEKGQQENRRLHEKQEKAMVASTKKLSKQIEDVNVSRKELKQCHVELASLRNTIKHHQETEVKRNKMLKKERATSSLLRTKLSELAAKTKGTLEAKKLKVVLEAKEDEIKALRAQLESKDAEVAISLKAKDARIASLEKQFDAYMRCED